MTDERARAEQFAGLFRAVYLTFHRRDGPRSQLPGASRAVLEHLALAGPLTVGEAAAHAKQDAVPLRDALRKLLHAAGDYKKTTEAVKRVCP